MPYRVQSTSRRMTHHCCFVHPAVLDFCPVAVPAARLTAARTSSTAVKAGYVPDGVSVKDWEAMKKAKSQKVASNKKYYKEKKHEVGFLACIPGHCCRTVAVS